MILINLEGTGEGEKVGDIKGRDRGTTVDGVMVDEPPPSLSLVLVKILTGI